MTLRDCRIFECKRCKKEVVICTSCDHGNRYCRPCAPVARAEKQRAAGRKYQGTDPGKLKHKVRQERCRAKQDCIDTDQKSLAAAKKAPLAPSSPSVIRTPPAAILTEGPGNVTHHGDIGAQPEANLGHAGIADDHEGSNGRRKQPLGPSSVQQLRCSFCGRPCRCAGHRRRPPRKGMHSFRRRPRLPGQSRFKLRI